MLSTQDWSLTCFIRSCFIIRPYRPQQLFCFSLFFFFFKSKKWLSRPRECWSWLNTLLTKLNQQKNLFSFWWNFRFCNIPSLTVEFPSSCVIPAVCTFAFVFVMVLCCPGFHISATRLNKFFLFRFWPSTSSQDHSAMLSLFSSAHWLAARGVHLLSYLKGLLFSAYPSLFLTVHAQTIMSESMFAFLPEEKSSAAWFSEWRSAVTAAHKITHVLSSCMTACQYLCVYLCVYVCVCHCGLSEQKQWFDCCQTAVTLSFLDS